MPTLEGLMAGLGKTYEGVIHKGGRTLPSPTRAPTGYFSLDLRMGGGFPRGRASIVWGQQSSFKTNLGLRTIAINQKLRPHERNVMIDVEGTFDPEWATIMGVDVDSLYVVQPDFAEQVVDMVDEIIKAEDCGVILLDSVASLMTTNESTSSADKAVVGGQSNVVSKLVRKVILGLKQARREGRDPVLLMIIQMRHKIGVMFGTPETMGGGFALKHVSSMTIKVYGKDVMETKLSEELPAYKKVSFTIEKTKVRTAGKSGELVCNLLPGLVVKIGDEIDDKEIKTRLDALGLFTGEAGNYTIPGIDKVFRTQKEFKMWYYQDDIGAMKLKSMLMDAFLSGVVPDKPVEVAVENQ